MATGRIVRTGVAARRGASVRAAQTTAAPSPRSSAIREERGGGSIRTSASRRGYVYDETDQEVEVLRREFPEGVEAAHVSVNAGLTVNLGNFESLRLDCSVRIPCLPTEIDAAYEIAAEFVSTKISEEQARWQGTGNGRSRG